MRESNSVEIYDVDKGIIYKEREKAQQHPSRKKKIQLNERVLIGSNHFYAPTKRNKDLEKKTRNVFKDKVMPLEKYLQPTPII